MSHFQTPQPISVVLELRVADVRIAAGERADTIVQVRPSDSSRRDDVTAAEHTRVEYADGRLLVKGPRRLRELSPFSDGGSIDVEIELPAGSDLSGHSAAGGFRCSGSLGHMRRSPVVVVSKSRADEYLDVVLEPRTAAAPHPRKQLSVRRPENPGRWSRQLHALAAARDRDAAGAADHRCRGDRPGARERRVRVGQRPFIRIDPRVITAIELGRRHRLAT
jgi:hypothetical protein